MVRAARSGRGGSRLFFWTALSVVVFTLFSAAIAIKDADRCGGADAPKSWTVFPPGWDCTVGR